MLQNTPNLGTQFFANMLQAQHNYNKTGDEQTMKLLINYYCDCVHYFESKQESISLYFKNKIKQLAKQIQQFGNPQHAERNKQKLNKKVIRAMQQQNIREQIKKSTQKQIKVNQAVNKIIESQFQNLQKRRQKKRSMIKSKSVTMSFASIDTSPQSKYMNNLKQIFGENMELNFNLDDLE